ncbi:hypothetical protein [Vampirovibrio sp.]|uniref:hypothetical protein n=1 Tax=Vampirovibrio sp. TaxID=2717857 RepID=UPI003593EF35
MPTISSPFQVIKASINPIRTAAPTGQASLAAIKPKPLDCDTLQLRFGNPPASEKKGIQKLWNTTWTHLKAGGKGAFSGFFNAQHKKWDAAYVIGGFLATLPFAAAIPGSHLILLPLLYLGSRTINGVYRGLKGLIKPSWIE